jgi:AcrR family transcriptional regulator
MARRVREEEYAKRRSEILAAAQRLVYTKGYEQMTIQDLLDDLHISKGAFYHYFGSKQALLDGMIERVMEGAEKVLLPIINDPQLPAIAKLNLYFATAGRWKVAQKAFMLALLRVWYADDNALVRQKQLTVAIKRIAPMLTTIVQQGLREGVMTTTFPDYVGELILGVFQGLGDTWAELLLADLPPPDLWPRMERIIAAYTEAMERILGVAPGSLHLIEREVLREWVAPLPS